MRKKIVTASLTAVALFRALSRKIKIPPNMSRGLSEGFRCGIGSGTGEMGVAGADQIL